MRQVKPLPTNISLAPTLAQRVFQLREFRNMTVRDLAKWARFTSKRIEDIEAGLESWLSSADRQRLAKALSVEPSVLEEVERRYYPDDGDVLETKSQQLIISILEGYRDLPCPVCGNTLRCSVQEGFDLEGGSIELAKAYCRKCPFVLR